MLYRSIVDNILHYHVLKKNYEIKKGDVLILLSEKKCQNCNRTSLLHYHYKFFVPKYHTIIKMMYYDHEFYQKLDKNFKILKETKSIRS